MTAMPDNPATKRRLPIPKYKPGILYAVWGRVERGDTPDICAVGQRNDCGMFLNKFGFEKGFGGMTLREELESRGYDLTTLRFSIRKKAANTTGTQDA